MAFIIPNIFVSGEKANAEDVNLNFNYLKEGLESVNTNLETKITTSNAKLEAEILDVKNTSDSVSALVSGRDTIVDLGEITTVDGEINLEADRVHKAVIKANSSLVLPVLENDSTFSNTMIEFTLAAECTLTIPPSVVWVTGEAPEISADGAAKNRLIFDSTTGGTSWMGYHIKDNA